MSPCEERGFIEAHYFSFFSFNFHHDPSQSTQLPYIYRYPTNRCLFETMTRGDNTKFSTLISATHGRQRREERGIDMVDLQKARKYGMREIARNGCYKYTYAGVVFIYNPKTNTEVTSYKCKDEIQDEVISTGTRFTKPIVLEKQKVDFKDVQSRKRTRDNLMKDKTLWTSHSVLVVDMSGEILESWIYNFGGLCENLNK